MINRGFGNWLADIAANMLCVILIILVVMSFARPDTSSSPAATSQRSPAVSGADAVAMLHQRLFPTDDAASFDIVTSQSAPLPQSDAFTLFVFDHQAYQRYQSQLQSDGATIRELSVPLALRNDAGTGWSSEFLALAQGPSDVTAFREALIGLLAADDAQSGQSVPQQPRRPLWRFFQTLGNAMLLLIGLLSVWRVSRPVRS